MQKPRKAIPLDVAERDFHNFNVFFRSHAGYEVSAFTAIQIPCIERRTRPATLTGPRHPTVTPIFPGRDLRELHTKFPHPGSAFRIAKLVTRTRFATEDISCPMLRCMALERIEERVT